MPRLYLTPLPDADAQRADKAVASAIEQAGLLEEGGVAVENVATENVDLVVEGQYRFGKLLSSKVADELDSLSESTYVALPLFDPTASSLGRARGYYELEDADVRPAKPNVEHVFEYTLTLTQAGTKESDWRATAIALQAVDGLHGTGDPVRVAIPASATSVQWYTQAAGATPASPTDTVTAEFGDLARYDPADAPSDTATLTYELPFADDGPTDVRVCDTRERLKFAATASGDEVNVWTHAYHTGYQFDGAPVIDTGRLRLYLGESPDDYSDITARTVADGETDTITSGTTELNTTLTVESGGTFVVESGGLHVLTGSLPSRTDIAGERWSDAAGDWVPIDFDDANPWTVTAWDFTAIGRANVQVQLTLSDGTDTERVNGLVERGADGVIWTTPENADPAPSGVVDLLAPAARDAQSWAAPADTLVAKSQTRD